MLLQEEGRHSVAEIVIMNTNLVSISAASMYPALQDSTLLPHLLPFPAPGLATLASKQPDTVSIHSDEIFLPLHRASRKRKVNLTDKQRRQVCIEAARDPILSQSQIARKYGNHRTSALPTFQAVSLDSILLNFS